MKLKLFCLCLALALAAGCSSGDSGGADRAQSDNQEGQESKDPTSLNLPILVQRADNRLTQGDLSGARRFLYEEVNLNPDSFEALYRLGVLDLLQDSLYVHERLGKAHELRPEHPGPEFFRGMVYWVAERKDLGRGFLADSYDLFFKNAEFNKSTLPEPARAYVDSFVSRRLKGAFRGFRSLALADSSNAALWFWYARSAVDYKKGDDAVSAIDRAKWLSPKSPEITALQAVIQYRSRNRYEARELALEALTLDPRNALGRHVLGHCLIDSGEYREGLIQLWCAMLAEPNETSFIDYVGNYLHSYASAPLGMKFIHLAVLARGFMAEQYDWPGYTLR